MGFCEDLAVRYPPGLEPRDGRGQPSAVDLPRLLSQDLDADAQDYYDAQPELAMVAHHILRHGAGQTIWPAFVF